MLITGDPSTELTEKAIAYFELTTEACILLERQWLMYRKGVPEELRRGSV